MSYLVGQGFSQRLACRVAGLSRSAYCRARAAGGAKTLRDHGPVRQWMNDFATTHRRRGYKRAWARAKSGGVVVGRDTFLRLWRAEGLRVRPRKAPKPRTAPRLQRLVKASAPGQVWAIDFQFDSDWKGRAFKVCNLIDEFTRQHLAFRIERRMGAADVIEMLDLAVLAHGAPQVLRADNGPEFIAAAMGRWASEHDTLQAFIPPGQPWHNGFVESLHNRMRDELLEDNMFDGLDHARTLIADWSRATMKSTPTARWAGSHPTSMRANGHNTTTNNTNNFENTWPATPGQAARRHPRRRYHRHGETRCQIGLPSATNPYGGFLSTGTCSKPSSNACGLSPASIAKLGRGGNGTTNFLAESAKHPTATSPTFARSSQTIRRSHNDP